MISSTLSIFYIICLSTVYFGYTKKLNKYYTPLEYSEWNEWANRKSPWEVPTQLNTDTEDGDYDFIIVGAGSAGSVIANRLSEVGNWKILLLEAGFPENKLTEFSIMPGLLQFTDYNWRYTTEPQPHMCLALEQQRCPWPRGKALGGSSTINYMVYSRGHPDDYDQWAALGNPGWSYADVLPYFRKSEDSRLNGSSEVYHSRGGYLTVNNPFISELGKAFIFAGEELGYKNTDYNSPEQIGFSKVQATIKQGRRLSSAGAFLTPILHRKNLKILIGATVTKVLIDPSSMKAFGVEFVWKNKQLIRRVAKEVILAAGALNSPQLLMLSGVGPKDHLDELGIITLNDLPVGQTLYDHVSFPSLVISTNLTTHGFNRLELLKWYTTGEGSLSSIGGTEALAFINTDGSKQQKQPNIELIFRRGSIRTDNGTIERKVLKVTEDYYNQMYAPLENTVSFIINPLLLHPKSRGYMKLKSAKPQDHPLFYPNYFSDPQNHDLQTLVAGIRVIMRLCETNAFKRVDARIITKRFVGCEHLSFNSDAHWQCALQLMSTPGHHQTSTCKMGPVDDPTAVVNHELKVYGIRNLRVADTSIIPIPLSAHTNAPAIMTGEVASDLIKRDWGVLQIFESFEELNGI